MIVKPTAQQIPGFTLIEVMVGMVIAAIVIMVGIQGFNTFRQSIEFEQGKNDLLTQIRTLQNSARNGQASVALVTAGTLPIDAQMDGFALFMSDTGATPAYTARSCLKVSPTSARLNCNVNEPTLTPLNLFNDLQLSFNTTSCRNIVFLRLSGEIFVLQSAGGTQYDPVKVGGSGCIMTVRHKNNAGLQDTITLDLLNNNISDT